MEEGSEPARRRNGGFAHLKECRGRSGDSEKGCAAWGETGEQAVRTDTIGVLSKG